MRFFHLLTTSPCSSIASFPTLVLQVNDYPRIKKTILVVYLTLKISQLDNKLDKKLLRRVKTKIDVGKLVS